MRKNWPKVRLAEVLHRSDAMIELQPDVEYRQITLKLWGKGAVLRGVLTGAEIASPRQIVARRNQFILSRIDARNGALGIVPDDLDGAIVSNDFPVFNVVADRMLPAYLGWMCKTAAFVEECRRASEGTTNRVRLQEDNFLAQKIPLPPLAEQRRVVARIDALAAKIHEARALREQATEGTNGLLVAAMRSLFMANNPDGWQSLSIENCCKAIIDYRGRTPPISEDGIPHLTSANIKNGRIDWNTSKFVTKDVYRDYMTRGIPEPGDVIFTMEAPLGDAGVVPDRRRFSLAQRTLLLRPNRNLVEPRFLARVLTSPDVREAIYAKATGTTVKGIASKRLKQILLPVPPIPAQHRIVDYLGDLQDKTDALKAVQAETSAELDALMPSILDKAFRGEL